MAIQRVEPRMQLQRHSLPGDEIEKTAAAVALCRQMLVAKILIKQREDFEFQISGAAIVDQLLRAQTLQSTRELRVGDARAPSSALGTLAVRVQPADADLIVDGEPWRGPEGPDRLLVQLPDGRHTVEIRKTGYRTYITEVDVHAGETTPLNVSLRQQDQP